MKTYEVTLTSPLLDGPLVMEMMASSPERARSRALGSAVHMYREPAMFDATTTVAEIAAFTD